MSGFKITCAGDDIVMPSIEALYGRKILRAEGADMVDLPRAIVQRTMRFSQSLNEVVAQLRKTSEEWHPGIMRDGKREDYDVFPLIDHFERCVYRAAELFEVYEKEVSRGVACLGKKGGRYKIERKDYDRIVSSHRDAWALICNRLKHNEAVLVPKIARFDASLIPPIFGFSLMEPVDGDALLVSARLHKRPEKARAITKALTQLVADIFRCDKAVAILIGKISDDGDQIIMDRKPRVSMVATLRDLRRLPVIAMPNEKPMFDGYELVGDELHFSRSRARQGEGKCSVTFHAKGDGISRTYDVGV